MAARILICLASAALLSAQCAWAQDPVAIDPKHHKVEFENDQVRVLRITFAPGERAPMHEHPCSIAIGIKDSALTFTFPDGTSRPTSLKQGAVVAPKPTKHQVANQGQAVAEVILVELKTSQCE